MSCVIVLPARLDSSRCPGKLLAPVGGKPLLAHALACAQETRLPVAVVTDSEEITAACSKYDVVVVRDPRPAANGTLRIARALPLLRFRGLQFETVVNWQADQVRLSAKDALAAIAHPNPGGVTTLVGPLEKWDASDRNTVKAACNWKRAYWFSRGVHESGWAKHLGLYVYSVATLEKIAELLVHPIAGEESLEQLTWICAGIGVDVVRATGAAFSVNTVEDLERFRRQVEA